jgi:hypothetical protein
MYLAISRAENSAQVSSCLAEFGQYLCVLYIGFEYARKAFGWVLWKLDLDWSV